MVSNPVFLDANTADAIFVDMPLVPPYPAAAGKRRADGGPDRLKFAKVLCLQRRSACCFCRGACLLHAPPRSGRRDAACV